jgi:Na+/proline symporter
MIVILAITTIIFIAINIIIGIYRKAGTNFSTFVSFKGQASNISIMLSIIGTVIGGGMFFTIGEMGFQAGVAPLAIALSYIIGFGLLSMIIPKIKLIAGKDGVDTFYDVVSDKLENKNHAKRYQASLAIITCLMYFFMLSGQFLILGSFYAYFLNIELRYIILLTVIIVAGGTLIYSILGGLKKDIATDIFQTITVFTAIAIVIVFIFLNKSWEDLASLPNQYFNGTGYGIAFPVGVLVFFSPAFIGRYDFWQRIISAKDSKAAKKSLWMSIIPIMLAYCVFVFLGMYAKANAAGDNIANVSVLWSIESILPTWAFAIVGIGLYGAVMSTADTLLNVSSVSLWKFVGMFGPIKLTQKNKLLSIRVMSLFVGIIACLLILVVPDIVILIVGAFSSLAIITPTVLYVLFSKKPSGIVATYSLVVPYVIFIVLFIAVPQLRLYAFTLGVVLSLILLSILSLTRRIRIKT